MKRAFSLIELLISLIVISCITAAFTPLITKKFSSGVFGGSNIKTRCEKFGEKCELCTNDSCLICSGLTCAEDEYKDSASCSCKKCSEKFGDDCTKCSIDKCLSCPKGQYLDEKNNCTPCTKKFNRCSSCDIYQCNECSDGYVLNDPTSSNPCSIFSCSSPNFMQIGNLCITKKNMGDSDVLTIPDGVNVVNVGETCTSSKTNFCCWTGSTAYSSIFNNQCDNSNGGGYSGCNRTVCDWYAADYICNNFNAGRFIWRLPTLKDMKKWDSYSKGKGVEGLQLCDYQAGYLSARCVGLGECWGSGNKNCNLTHIWSSTSEDSTHAYSRWLEAGVWEVTYYERTFSMSPRCVADMPESCADKIGEGCLSCDGNICLSCDTGYVLKNGKCEIDCAIKFGTNCTSCTKEKCTACTEGCKLSSNPSGNPACESDFTCSGTNFIQIGNLCVTRRNMGDSDVLAIPSDVNVLNAGSSCNPSSTNFCCWNGNTSSACDNENGGGYSACNRTVCPFYTANHICNKYNYGGKTWRLPTSSEMSNWALLSQDKGINGLQLCDYVSGYSSARCDAGYGKCLGGNRDTCYPMDVWSADIYSDTHSYDYYLGTGVWNFSTSNKSDANSVRCVTEL